MQNIKQTWDAKLYSENSSLQYKASKRFFSDLPLSGTEMILDIGCGTGLLTSEIAQRVPHGKIIGIDSSEKMIEFANEHYSQPNLEFILMSAEELNFPFNFDVIISSFCIHWIDNKQALFYKVAKQLKLNGLIRFIMPLRHPGIATIRSQLMIEPKWSQYFNSNLIQEILIFEDKYKNFAEEAGLDNVVYEKEDVVTHFESATALRNFLKNITSYLNCLPTEELQNQFMQEVVALYLQKNPHLSDDRCSVTYTYGKIRSQGIRT